MIDNWSSMYKSVQHKIGFKWKIIKKNKEIYYYITPKNKTTV